MLTTTQAWKDYSVDYSNYKPYIIVIKDGNPIWAFDSNHIAEGTLRFTDDVCEVGDFNIGATVANNFSCDIINFDDSFPNPGVLEGATARLYFSLNGFQLDILANGAVAGTAVVGEAIVGGLGEYDGAIAGLAVVGRAIVGKNSPYPASDFIRRGTYRLDPINSVGRTVHISGSDFMADDRFNSSDIEGYDFTGKTCYQVLRNMGFPVLSGFPHYDYVLPNIQATEEQGFHSPTKRTILGYIAQICGCYARFNHVGQLELKAFPSSGTAVELTKIMQEPDVNYYTDTVTGVFVSGNDNYKFLGTDGYCIFIENNPFIIADNISTIANWLYTALNGLTFTPFAVTYIADPAIEAGDIVEFENNGVTTTTIMTSLSYGLGQLSNISTEADEDSHYSADTLTGSMSGTVKAVKELHNGSVLKKIINLSGDEVQIEADNININGVVSANGNFKVNTDGTVEAVNGKFRGRVDSQRGKIGNWTLNEDSIYGQVVPTYITAEIIGDVMYNGTVVETFRIQNKNEDNSADPLSSYNIMELETVASFENGDVDVDDLMYIDSLGDLHAQHISAISVTQTSDRRLKKDIVYLDKEKSAEAIYSYKPCEYSYIKGDDKRHRGFIADEIDGEWTPVVDMKDGYKAIAYTEIIADLVATVQTLNERIKQLEDKLNGTD